MERAGWRRRDLALFLITPAFINLAQRGAGIVFAGLLGSLWAFKGFYGNRADHCTAASLHSESKLVKYLLYTQGNS